jgi:hypothetical protein
MIIGIIFLVMIYYFVGEKMYLPDLEGTLYNKNIALFLAQHTPPLSIDPIPSFSIEFMICQDGSVLMKTSSTTDGKEEYRFQQGLIDKKSLTAFQNKLVSLFRLKDKRIRMQDLGPDASYMELVINTDNCFVTIETWEQYNNARFYSDHLMLHKRNTTDNKWMYLPEFYEKWKATRNEIVAAFQQSLIGSVPQL